MKTSISKIPILSVLVIFLVISIGAAWDTNYFVVDAIIFKLNVITPVFAIIALLMTLYEIKKPSKEISITLSQFLLLTFFYLPLFQ